MPINQDVCARAVRQTDEEFLRSIGVKPYRTVLPADERAERLRSRCLQAVALIQAAALLGGLIWTWGR